MVKAHYNWIVATYPLIEHERITHCICTDEFINDLQEFAHNFNHFYLRK